MSKYDKYNIQFFDMIRKRGGYFFISDVIDAGIDTAYAYWFLEKQGDSFARCTKGVYVSMSVNPDWPFIVQIHNRAIISGRTALDLHGLTKKPDNPGHVCITVPTQYNPSRLSADNRFAVSIDVVSIKNSLFELGKTEMVTPLGNTISIYNKERCICDIVRTQNWKRQGNQSDTLTGEVCRAYFGRDASSESVASLLDMSQFFRIQNRIGDIVKMFWDGDNE